MMLSSTAAARETPRGLGVDWSCYLMPWTPSCAQQFGQVGASVATIPSQEEQNAAIKVDIEKAAGAGTANYNPDLAAEQYQAYLADTQAYCTAHPSDCADYQAEQHPTCSLWLGTSTLAQSFCKNPGAYAIVGTAAIIGIVLLMGKKGGR